MATTKTIAISNLIVNTENYRFNPVDNQKEAINQMVENQKDNLFNLAESMVKIGLNPNDPIQTTLSNHDAKKYIVLEGNRRTVALKLLINPELVEGNAGLKRKFKKLHDSNLENLPKSISCVVYDDPKDADMWIGIKHGYGKAGIGTHGWDPLQKDNFSEKTEGKTSTSIQVIKLIKSSSGIPQKLKDQVEKISTTNLDRLLSDPLVRDFIGIEINNGLLKAKINETEALKGLTQIIKDILDPNFTVKKIYSKDDRKDYLKNFPEASIPNKSVPISVPKPLPSAPIPSPTPKPALKPLPNATDRKRLIPKSCVLRIGNPKVNAIYHELKEIDIKHKNAVAVLFRVFIELSIDCYIDDNLASGTSSAKSGLDFQTKISRVAQHLETVKKADSAICKGIKASIKDKNDILGIDTWHAYVHNNMFSPQPANLIITWDNVEKFVTILWENTK